MTNLVLSGPQLVIDGAGESAFTALSDGTFLAVWPSYEGGSKVLGQIFNADGTPKGAAFTISQTNGGTNGDFTVCAAIDGGFVVGWVHNTGGRRGSKQESSMRAGAFPASTLRGPLPLRRSPPSITEAIRSPSR